MDILTVANANNLIEAYRNSAKSGSWKSSVQKYGLNLLRNVYQTRKALLSGKYTLKPCNVFTLSERGKARLIRSIHISDRVVQRCLCDNVLLPSLQKYLIYDNGASLKDKGVNFTRKRIVKHLARYYKKYGRDGYILQIDFSKFFDNIPHDIILRMFYRRIKDEGLQDLIAKIIRTFRFDISDYPENYFDDKPFDALAHRSHWSEKGLSFLNRSMGIGSQISQIGGIFYLSPIDNYCKIVKGCHFYGRYMDDIYIIHPDKDFLKNLLVEIRKLAEDIGAFINQKKTQIVKLSHGFTFLKIKHYITPKGRIVRTLSRCNIVRERRKLKKFRHFLDSGEMAMPDIQNQYNAWRGGNRRFNSYTTLKSFDRLFNRLFKKEVIK